jgi:hypothetical protein
MGPPTTPHHTTPHYSPLPSPLDSSRGSAAIPPLLHPPHIKDENQPVPTPSRTIRIQGETKAMCGRPVAKCKTRNQQSPPKQKYRGKLNGRRGSDEQYCRTEQENYLVHKTGNPLPLPLIATHRSISIVQGSTLPHSPINRYNRDTSRAGPTLPCIVPKGQR